MANTKQARKRVRQDIEHNLRLTAQRTRYRTAIKAVEKLVAAGNKAAAAEEFKKTSGILDRLSCRQEPSVCRYQGDGLIASDPEGALVSFPPEKKRTDFSALFFVFSKDESQPAGVVEPDSHYLFRLTTLS